MAPTSTIVPDVLIHVDEAEAAGGSGRALRDACRRGHLVRVRRGSYCPRALWESLDPRDQHILTIRATIRRVQGPFLVAGGSAAAIRGLPYASRGLDVVTILVPHAGGGSSEPGVIRTTVSFDAAVPDEVDGIPVTTSPRSVLDHARVLPFPRAVAVVDHARSRRTASAVDGQALAEELWRAAYVRGRHGVGRVLDFSTDLSDSVGESEARAGIHLAGFEVPQLQRRWRDAEGVIESDFYWESVDTAGEFDGKVKYTRDEYTGGDPAGVVWREKLREDRLRRVTSGVVRLVTDDVRSRLRLTRILSDAGIPRAR